MLDDLHFRNFTRMSALDFEFLLNLAGPNIKREDSNFREAISAQTRLAITLRFLSTGDSYSSLQYTFHVSKQSIGNIVIETCEALIAALKDYIIKVINYSFICILFFMCDKL